MSILRAVIRATVVAALRDRTWAKDRVFDSDLTPIAQAVEAAQMKPYITVYTDDDTRSEIDGLGLFLAKRRRLAIVMEMGVASAITVPVDPAAPDGDQTLKISFAATDQAYEWAIDGMEMQVVNALVTDPKSAWGSLFKALVRKLEIVPSKRGGKSEAGTRYAARQLIFVVDPTVFELAPGVEMSPDHPYNAFIALASAPGNPFGEGTDYATMLTQLLNPTSAPDWAQAEALLGVTGSKLGALGVGPLTVYGSGPTTPAIADAAVTNYDGGGTVDTTLPDNQTGYAVRKITADQTLDLPDGDS